MRASSRLPERLAHQCTGGQREKKRRLCERAPRASPLLYAQPTLPATHSGEFVCSGSADFSEEASDGALALALAAFSLFAAAEAAFAAAVLS